MSLTVYSISGSPIGWRVLLGLSFKRLDYRVVYLRGDDKEHQQAPFLKMNPHGKVPVLAYRGTFRRESLAILGWLDQEFPDAPLFGSSPARVHAVWTCAAGLSDYLLRATNGVVFPAFRGTDGAPRTTADEPAPEHAAHLLSVELQALDDSLSGRAFLCGAEPTAADAVAFPDIGRLQRARDTRPRTMTDLGFGAFDRDFPNIARWRDRIVALPGHADTVPPHWITPKRQGA